MTFQEAQQDMRQAYYNGGPGVLISGIIWTLAGIGAAVSTPMVSALILFFGGMLIYPLGMVLSKGLKRSGKHQSGNPLAALAIESTVVLFIGLFLAYIMYQVDPNWFFPTMLVIIGGRYTLFQTLYGARLYWVLGAVLIMAGIGCFIFSLPFYAGAFMGGIGEFIFALALFRLDSSQVATS